MKHTFNVKRLLIVIFLLANAGLLNLVNAQQAKPAQTDPLFTKAIGAWDGTLDAGGNKLPLVFKIKKDEQQKFVVTLDSPAQNGFNIPLGGLSNEAGQLKIDAPSINGYYIGKFLDASTLEGTWNQNGAAFPLKLIKQKEVK